jgi:hypothetical protein
MTDEREQAQDLAGTRRTIPSAEYRYMKDDDASLAEFKKSTMKKNKITIYRYDSNTETN